MNLICSKIGKLKWECDGDSFKHGKKNFFQFRLFIYGKRTTGDQGNFVGNSFCWEMLKHV